MHISQRALGYSIATIGLLVALFAFFSLPYITQVGFPVVGTPPGQTTVHVVTYTLAQRLFENWISLLVGILVSGLLLGVVIQGVRSRGRRGSGRPGTKLLTVVAALVLFGLLSDYLSAFPPRIAYYDYIQTTFANGGSSSAGSSFAYYLGPGFWLYATGVVLAIAGGLIAARFESSAPIQQENVA